MKKTTLRTAIFCLLLPFFYLAVGRASALQKQPHKFFFFNPDSAQNNLSLLKSQMDVALAGAGLDLQFQPFAHFADFDARMRQQKPAFQWVPEWYVARYGKNLGLVPFLVAVRNGKSTYRKILVCSNKKRLTLADLTGKTMAMTTMGPDRRKILGEILFTPFHLETTGLVQVEVPKDSDALLALMLGQVDFALVSEDNLKILRRLSSAVERNVVQLKETMPISMPYLCYLRGTVGENELARIKNLFLGSKPQSDCRELMEMLHIDAWQTVSH